MLHFNGTIIPSGAVVWELLKYEDSYIDDGLTISFPLPLQLDTREALNYLKAHLPDKEKQWVTFMKGSWTINLTVFLETFKQGFEKMIEDNKPYENNSDAIHLAFSQPIKLTAEMLKGSIKIIPEVSHRDLKKVSRTTVNFIITHDMIIENKPKRIFLSHKSADKPMVRSYKDMLRVIGFDPWMDEDDLKAGDKLHRGIEKGFKDSCAAIFFVTKNYIDENYLATEVDYAMTQHYEKGDRFKIITLLIGEPDDDITVPSLLKQFVFKSPQSQFQGLTDIINALPLKIDNISFKE